jgi:hypothetical protein
MGLQGVHGRPRYAKLSIHDDSKEKIAPVHSDFECGLWPLSLMGFADWLLYRKYALKVLRLARVLPITVLPVLPSLFDRLRNRWIDSLLFVVLNSYCLSTYAAAALAGRL